MRKGIERQQEDAGKQHRLNYNNPSDDFHKHSLFPDQTDLTAP